MGQPHYRNAQVRHTLSRNHTVLPATHAFIHEQEWTMPAVAFPVKDGCQSSSTDQEEWKAKFPYSRHSYIGRYCSRILWAYPLRFVNLLRQKTLKPTFREIFVTKLAVMLDVQRLTAAICKLWFSSVLGPITTAATYTRRLNYAGKFLITQPRSDKYAGMLGQIPGQLIAVLRGPSSVLRPSSVNVLR